MVVMVARAQKTESVRVRADLMADLRKLASSQRRPVSEQLAIIIEDWLRGGFTTTSANVPPHAPEPTGE